MIQQLLKLSFHITDGSNAVTESVVISFTDVNDQTPAVTVAATYTQAESASTAFQTSLRPSKPCLIYGER